MVGAHLRGITLDAAPGELVGILGPNGSGKSSFLRTVYRALRPNAGLITLDDDNLWQLSGRVAAQRTAAVIQEPPGDFDFSVHDVVFMGRTPHKGALDRESVDDRRIVDDALARVGWPPSLTACSRRCPAARSNAS